MKVFGTSWLGLCLLVVVDSYGDGALLKDSCVDDWEYDEEKCWHEFNETDYCSAIEMCAFYGSYIDANVADFNSSSSNTFWRNDITRSLQNLSCSASSDKPHTSHDTCPIKLENGTKTQTNCNSTLRFICSSDQTLDETGIRIGTIKDHQLSSSSAYRSDSEPIAYKARFGRLENEYTPGTASEGGWCSNSASMHEYFEVDFGCVVLVTELAMQGVQSRICDHWVTLFNISYNAYLEEWTEYTNDLQNHTFIGNENAQQIRIIEFEKPFLARFLRIKPFGFADNCLISGDRYCLRLEIYGLNLKVFSDFMINMSNTSQSTLMYNRENDQESLVSYEPWDEWPTGSYALPRPKSGCPFSRHVVWLHGYRLHDVGVKPSTIKADQTHLQNSVSSNFIVEEFCSKRSSWTDGRANSLFPPGKYCLYKVDDSCPPGFQTGSLRFYEDGNQGDRTWTHMDGITPKYETNFNMSDASCCYLEMFYCCRNDTDLDALVLPALMPFYLLPLTDACPDVTNTINSLEYMEFSFANRSDDIGKLAFGVHPYVSNSAFNGTNSSTIRYHLCYYEPYMEDSTYLELKTLIEANETNANFPADMKILMLSNGTLIRYGNLSSVWLNITVHANCTVLQTDKQVQSIKGIGYYNGSIFPGTQCIERVTDVIFRVEAILPQIPYTLIAQVNLTMVSTCNIVVILRKRRLKLLPHFNDELKQLANQLMIEAGESKRDIRLDIVSYNNANEVITKLQTTNVDRQGDPKRPHGIVGVDVEDVQDVLSSFTRVHGVPFITGITSGVRNPLSNRKALQYGMVPGSSLHLLFSKLKGINITDLVIIRSNEIKIPTSFAYYLLKMSVKVSKDILIDQQASRGDIAAKLTQLKESKSNIYFIIGASTASNLFITAVKERVSPRDGYVWISGSERGVYEHGIASKDCYMLRPITCSEAFNGVLMMKGFNSEGSFTSFISEERSGLDLVTLNGDNSPVSADLLRGMVLDGITAIANSIKMLSTKNETITTAKLLSSIRQITTGRLKGFRFVDNEEEDDMSHNVSSNCLRGWLDSNCSSPVCLDYHCQHTQGKCVGNKLCECLPGFFGRDCSGHCKDRCQNGVCNEGALGDGTCVECEWMYEGVFCDHAAVLQALIAGSIGSFVVIIIITCYLLKYCRPRQSIVMEGELDETYLIIDWEEVTSLESINLKNAVVSRHLSEKFGYTEYFKGKHGESSVFVKCIKKKPVKLSLDVRMEIRKVRHLDHINIEKVKSVCLGPPHVAIITELASMGSLYDTIHAENVEVPLEIKYTFMEDICRGMMYLHDECGMSHGRLKSTNCLLHKGWRLKITDIGLGSLRKNIESFGCQKATGYCNYDPNKQNEDTLQADYNSLLWTAPEYLGPKIVNIDQIGHVKFEADVYSFGIIMAEILSRRPPYGEIKVMSTQHIIEAVAHLREPMVDLEVIRPGSPRAGNDMLSKNTNSLRPSIRDSYLPKDEPGRSILKLLIESAWSDDCEARPPFSHIKTVLRIIAPLKGHQIEKRAFLLEKETEALERYIAYDTRMIKKERDKVKDWLSRSLPSDVYDQLQNGKQVEATVLDNVSVAAFRIADFHDIVLATAPNELTYLLDYLVKSFQAVAVRHGLELTDIEVTSDLCVISGRFNEPRTDSIVRFCLAMLHSAKDLKMEKNPGIKLKFSVVLHSGEGVAGLINDVSNTARYHVVSRAIKTTLRLLDMSRPNCLLITEPCANLLKNKENISLVEISKTPSNVGEALRTYWVVST